MVLVTPAVSSGDGDNDGPKSTKISTIDQKGGSGAERRLVEYFVVVSSVPSRLNLNAAEGNKNEAEADKINAKVNLTFDIEDVVYEGAYDLKPTLTARYPVTDHRDNPLHENVTFFCHPTGGIRLRMDPHMPKIHYFVATGGHGAQMYGTCLTLWEPCELEFSRKPVEGGTATAAHPDEIKKEVFLPKCLVLLSTYPYLMAFREYLTQLTRLSKSGEMSLPIERYIVNFCSEIPAPPSGSFEVQTTILDSVIKIWSPPDNQPIAWVSLPFGNVFECLDTDNIILVWHCLVLERQVLFTSTQLSILTITAEIFLSLLFPMRWSHAYIPILPHFLIPILSAPMPFLCGITKANLAEALYDLSSECVLVDLDKNLVTLGPDTEPLPPIPPGQKALLKQQLEENVGMVFREARCLTKNDDYSNSGAHLPNHIKLMAEGMWESKLSLFDEAFHLMFTPEEARKNMLNGNDTSGMDFSDRELDPTGLVMTPAEKQTTRRQSQWDAVQEAFLDTFVFLLRNYRKFLVFPSKHNEGSYGGAGFRSKEFLESQRFDMREFLTQMIGTQMFDNFITKRLYGSGEPDVAFFDMAVDRFLKSAGYFSDIDVTGRIMHAGGVVAQKVAERGTPAKSLGGAPQKTTAIVRKPYSSKPADYMPLLQSARVHRKLKTIVPPEPTGEGLPLHSSIGDANFVAAEDDKGSSHDVASVGSRSSDGGTRSNPDAYLSVQDKAALIIEKQKKRRYMYPTFPPKFNDELFGTPRPLPSAVIAEFDRQRKDAAQFRRKKPLRQAKDRAMPLKRAHAMTENEIPPSPEVATFTVFFMAFTAMVGKELLEIEYDPNAPEKPILSTYVPVSQPFDEGEDTESTATGRSDQDTVDEAEKEGIAELKTTRPEMSGMFDDSDDVPTPEPVRDVVEEKKTSSPEKDHVGKENGSVGKSKQEADQKQVETGNGKSEAVEQGPRMRFKDKLSELQIEEAKATGRAQLGLAFEMLTMMKKRALKADPEAYQCLIDACGRVGDTKRATDLLAKMHEDGIVADGTVYACLVSAFSAESAWKKGSKTEELPAWANSSSIEMDWNKLQKRSLFDRLRETFGDIDEDDDDIEEGGGSNLRKIRQMIARTRKGAEPREKNVQTRMEFFVTETVERQIALGENLLEIVFPDISVDTENETCPRCNYLLSDDDVVNGWTPGDNNEYTTSCPNCTQRFVPHFCVQSTSSTFMGSRGPASPLMCERLSPWVLQKEIRLVMSEKEGIENLLSPEWREQEYKNGVLWWNLVLSCMRYRFPFSFLLQGSFEQNLITPMPEDDA